MILYRAVSEEEFADLMATGVFACPPGALEAKWFAETAADAREWGRRFAQFDGRIYRIVEVEILATPASQRHPRLDGIGPAWWLELDQLKGARIREVQP